MRIIIMHDWSALMRKHVLITGAVALIGISVSPVQAEVLSTIAHQEICPWTL
jgi:hypothetical protein